MRADGLRSLKFGILFHFLAGLDGERGAAEVSPGLWNARVNAFDTEALADQLEALGAGYFCITLGQNSGYYCAPNDVLSELLPGAPRVERDLVSDLYDSLARRGIALGLYVSGNPYSDSELFREGLIGDWQWTEEAGEASFMHKWGRIVGGWVKRYRNKCRLLWVDGCYNCVDPMCRLEEPNLGSVVRGIREADPALPVSLNGGIFQTVFANTGEGEDFTSGESEAMFVLPGISRGRRAWPQDGVCDDELFHVFALAGEWWGYGKTPRLPNEFVAGYTKQVADAGGIVTWDVPCRHEDGTMLPEYFEQFRSIRRIL